MPTTSDSTALASPNVPSGTGFTALLKPGQSAFQPLPKVFTTTPQQKAVTPTPPVPTPPATEKKTEPTILSSANTDTKVQDNAGKLAQISNQGKPGFDVFGNPVANTGLPSGADLQNNREAGGTYQGQDGNLYYNYDSTPVTGQGSMIPGTTTPSTGDTAVDAILKQFSDLKTSMDATSAASISNIQKQYESLIQQQTQINAGQEAGVNKALIAGGSQRYAPGSSSGIIATQMSYGLNQIADLQGKEQAAIIAAQQAAQSGDQKLLDSQLSIYEKVREEKQSAAQKLNEQLQTEKRQATKDAAISSQLQSGVTDPAEILKNLQASGDNTITAKDITDAINSLHPDAKNVIDLAKVATDNGAPADVREKILKSASLDEAYQAAGNYAAQGTGMVAEYNYAKANGYTGTFSQYQNEDAARKANATAGVGVTAPETPVGLGADKSGGSILSATGLSVAAFNFLTQGTASMSRMPAAQRNQIMKEAQDYLNRTGTDISTFQSQYKAYNDVLQKNISRANQTSIMAGEVAGSADALISVIDEKDIKDPFNPLVGLSHLKPAAITQIALGNTVNDPIAMKYSTQIQFMANDLAGYLAASRGSNQPENVDIEDASRIISTGLSKGSTQAFKEAVNANEEKVNAVVNKAVDSTRKQVWGLFGVSDKFKGGNSVPDSITADHSQDQQKVIEYGDQHPEIQQHLIQMENDGASYSDILNWINQ